MCYKFNRYYYYLIPYINVIGIFLPFYESLKMVHVCELLTGQ